MFLLLLLLFFKCFWKESLMLTKAKFDLVKKYSKHLYCLIFLWCQSWVFSIITPVFMLHYVSEIILICRFGAQETFLKTVCFCGNRHFFQDSWSFSFGIERHIYLKHNIVNVFTDTFDQFNASLLNKILIIFFNYLFIYYKIIIINIVKKFITIWYFSKWLHILLRKSFKDTRLSRRQSFQIKISAELFFVFEFSVCLSNSSFPSNDFSINSPCFSTTTLGDVSGEYAIFSLF